MTQFALSLQVLSSWVWGEGNMEQSSRGTGPLSHEVCAKITPKWTNPFSLHDLYPVIPFQVNALPSRIWHFQQWKRLWTSPLFMPLKLQSSLPSASDATENTICFSILSLQPIPTNLDSVLKPPHSLCDKVTRTAHNTANAISSTFYKMCLPDLYFMFNWWMQACHMASLPLYPLVLLLSRGYGLEPQDSSVYQCS